MTYRSIFLLICLVVTTMTAAAQADVSSSEIEGFRFSTYQKVKGLSLLGSTKEDVMAIFGEECVHGCKFDDDWDISFAYVGAGWTHTTSENGIESIYKPIPAYIGTLADVSFKPRRVIVLPGSTVFPPQLKCQSGDSVRDGQRFRTAFCTDHRSLTYYIYDETDPLGKFQKNQVQQISYSTIPTDKIFDHKSDAVRP